MQRWVCPNCSYGNGMHQHQCARCRFEPVGLDLPPPKWPAAPPEPEPAPETAGARAVETVILVLLGLLAGWLAWMAMSIPPAAKVPFALYIVVCLWVGIWIIQARRRVRKT